MGGKSKLRDLDKVGHVTFTVKKLKVTGCVHVSVQLFLCGRGSLPQGWSW